MKEEKEQRQAVRHAAAPLTITNIHRGHLTQRHTSLTIGAAACSTRYSERYGSRLHGRPDRSIGVI